MSSLAGILFVVYFYFFLMWTVFKVFIEFATVLLLFHVLVFWPKGMRDLGSLTENRACTPACGGVVLTAGLPGNSLTGVQRLCSAEHPSWFSFSQAHVAKVACIPYPGDS